MSLVEMSLVARWFGGEVTRPPCRQVRGLAIPSNEQGWVVLSSGQISIQWTAPFVSLILIRWIVIYPVDMQLVPVGYLRNLSGFHCYPFQCIC